MERHALLDDLMERGLSARAACRWRGCSRAVATDTLKRPPVDATRLKKMRCVAEANPRYGYRRVAVESDLSFGEVWRLWKEHDSQCAPQRLRRQRAKHTPELRPLQAEYPYHGWTHDILYDTLADGRVFKTLSVLDEFTRECLTIHVARAIRAEAVVTRLQKLFRHRMAPQFLRSDNGREFTAAAVRVWLEASRVGSAFIPPPDEPWHNGFIESVHDKFCDECLNREGLYSLAEAQVVIEQWRKHYNTKRPHSSFGYQTPARFAATHPTHRAQSLTSRGHKKGGRSAGRLPGPAQVCQARWRAKNDGRWRKKTANALIAASPIV